MPLNFDIFNYNLFEALFYSDFKSCKLMYMRVVKKNKSFKSQYFLCYGIKEA